MIWKTLIYGAAFTATCTALSANEALVDYIVVDAASIPAPLVAWDGPAEAGAAVFAASGCADCHRAPGHEEAPRIGPDLAGIGNRLTQGEIRLMIVEPSISNPETEMPAYYSIGVVGEVEDDLVGRTRLGAAEVEQLVLWLSNLTTE